MAASPRGHLARKNPINFLVRKSYFPATSRNLPSDSFFFPLFGPRVFRVPKIRVFISSAIISAHDEKVPAGTSKGSRKT